MSSTTNRPPARRGPMGGGPFGGIGMSGQGRLGGLESVHAFTEQRTLYLHGTRLGVPILKNWKGTTA